MPSFPRRLFIHFAFFFTAILMLLFFIQQSAPAIAASPDAFVCSSVTEIPTPECEGLVALANSTNYSNWVNHTNWLVTNTPCSWFGVACDAGHVIRLHLDNNGLQGMIPNEIGNLTNLISLLLDRNQLAGPIPISLVGLTHLEILRLFGNQLSGEIPPQIKSLTNLKLLYLHDNQLTGTIPPELGQLTELTELILENNPLGGTIPATLGNLKKLTALRLGRNQLRGSIPIEMSHLSNLIYFDLFRNQLSGPLPAPFTGELTNLVYLRLNENQLNGLLPSDWSRLTKLETLYLNDNQLRGEIPASLCSLPALKILDLKSNMLYSPNPAVQECLNGKNPRWQETQYLPLIEVIPTALVFDALEGQANPAPGALVFQNNSGNSLDWTATEDITWLSLSQATGTATDTPTTVQVAVNTVGLAAGVYEGQITITSPGAQNNSQVIDVRLQLVSATPKLAVSLAQLTLAADTESSNPTSETIAIQNTGGGVLKWTASENIPWLSLDKTTGTAPDQIKTTINIAGLSQGSYNGDITITGAGATGSPVVIPVTLQLATVRQIALSTQRLDFNFTEGETPPAQTFALRNLSTVGSSTFAWQATADVPWLKLNIASGTATTTETPISVAVETGQLAPGNHTGKITISSPDPVKGNPQTITVLVAITSKKTAFCLPGRTVPLVKTTTVRLDLKVETATNKATGGCDITGTMELQVPQNKFMLTYSGQVDAIGQLRGAVANPITLDLAKSQLTLSDIKFDDATLTAHGVWSFEALGAGRFDVSQVRIDHNGLALDGKYTYPLTINLNLEGFAFAANQVTLRLTTSTDSYELDIDGTIKLNIPGIPPFDVALVATVSRQGVKVKANSSVTLPDFSMSLAGLTLQIHGATLGVLVAGQPPYLFAQQATLKVPGAWGGLTQAVYDVKIDTNGHVTIGGGRFRLPQIKAGGFKLGQLEGSLIRVGNGYEIAAAGVFQIVAGPAGACELKVNITLYAGPGGASVLAIDSPQSAGTSPTVLNTNAAPAAADGNLAPDGLVLREFGIGVWDCKPGIPIGNSGLFITGVQGSITLRANIQSVNVKIQVQTSLVRVGNISALSAEAGATVARNRRTGKVAIDFDAIVKIIGVKASQTHVKISDRAFFAELEFKYLIIKGKINVQIGYSKQFKQVAFGGAGSVKVEVRKGQIWKKKICIPNPFGKDPCETIKIPPFNWRSPSINAQFGTFRNRAIGFKGYVEYGVYEAGFYVDTNGVIDFGKVNEHKLISPGAVRQAKQAWQAMQHSGQTMAAAKVDHQFTFAEDGSVLIDVSISTGGSGLPTINAEQPVPITLKSDVIFALAQPLTGTLRMTLLNPSGTSITPDNLPGGVTYEETVDEDGIQYIYAVHQANPGIWQIRLEGNLEISNYLIAVIGNTPAPQLSGLSLTSTGIPNQVAASWKLLTNEPTTKINIYATTDPITSTIAVTDTNGAVSTTTVPLYTGQLMIDNLPSATNDTLQSQTVDLSGLPSGVYSLWLEADDGQNPSVQGYLLQGGAVARFTVTHNTDFPTTWSPVFTPKTDSKNQLLLVSWDANPHPDIDDYALHMRTTDPLSPTVILTDVIIVGSDSLEPTLSAVIDGVEPGYTYELSVCAEDVDMARTVCSAELSYTTPQSDFVVSAVADQLAIPAGQTVVATIQVQMSEDLPHPVSLQPDYAHLPDGFLVLFDRTLVTSTAVSAITVSIAADEGMLTGDYVVPIIAYSGMIERGLSLHVQVLPKLEAGDKRIFLPLLTRQ